MDVYIFGIGNYSEVIIELALDCGHDIKGLYHYDDSRTGERVMGYKILGDYNTFYNSVKSGNIIVSVGDNHIRRKNFEEFEKRGYNLINLIHPNASISSTVEIGKGVYIHNNAMIWTKSFISDYSIISPKALISHHVKIGLANLISAGSTVGAYVTLNENVLVGNAAIILPKKMFIAKNTVIGAGSVVTKTCEENSIMVGNPAKNIN
ncbi:NeuD/PglB/VioB family sugar acetyltransferase [Aureivirga sp. CE67]|uniref:NeuD/PglB/VioB family sugar acetyltransferase n=1 Tax=Aureivirga sp. CE67 TaxID=1788983 RepID=UPI0018CA2E1A|nr:NeuD/PglB/VioB family sugar acetyltransferase [Aureivirga sp. CE67]